MQRRKNVEAKFQSSFREILSEGPKYNFLCTYLSLRDMRRLRLQDTTETATCTFDSLVT